MAKFILEFSRSKYMGTLCNSVGEVADSIWGVVGYGEEIQMITIVYGAGITLSCVDLASFYHIINLISQHHDRIAIYIKEIEEV
jgi:hypothetical protein